MPKLWEKYFRTLLELNLNNLNMLSPADGGRSSKPAYVGSNPTEST